MLTEVWARLGDAVVPRVAVGGRGHHPQAVQPRENQGKEERPLVGAATMVPRKGRVGEERL